MCIAWTPSCSRDTTGGARAWSMEPYLTGSKFLVFGVSAEKNQRMVTIGTTVEVQCTRDVLRTWLFDPAPYLFHSISAYFLTYLNQSSHIFLRKSSISVSVLEYQGQWLPPFNMFPPNFAPDVPPLKAVRGNARSSAEVRLHHIILEELLSAPTTLPNL